MIPVSPENDTFDPDRVGWVFDEDDLGHCLAAIEGAFECVLDLETTGLFEHAVAGGQLNGGVPARVVLASLTLPASADDEDPFTWAVPLSHPDSPWSGTWRKALTRIAEAISDYQVPLVNQNVKFDCRWVKAHTGIDLSSLIAWDNQMSNQLLDETTSARLKVRVPAEFGIEAWDDFPLDKPGAAERVPLMDLGLYAARDTYWTWKQARRHRQRMFLGASPDTGPDSADEIEDARLGRLATWSVMPSVAALTAVEQRGMLLDREWVHARLAENQSGIDPAREWLIGRYPKAPEGDPSFAPTSHWFRAWTELAVEAGDLRVASMTRQGNAQWTKGVLLRQSRQGSEVASTLLGMRSLMKENEFLRSWLGYATPWSTVHASYNVGRAATGRTSSSDPNNQQVKAVLKQAYIPRPGYCLAEFDLSQIELRVAAFLSRSVPMMAAFRDGLDLHAMLAAQMARVPLASVQPGQRQQAKAGNFALLFGMGAAGLMSYAEAAYDVILSFPVAQALHSAFFTTWDGIGQWHQSGIARAHRTGQIVSPVGRVRRIPEIMSGDDYLVGAAERIALNSPVQGFASDILLTALSIVGGTVPGYRFDVRGARVVGTVHDSVVAELPQDHWQETAERILYAMTTGVLSVLQKMGCDFDVPLAAECKVGSRWGLDDIGKLTEG